MRENPLKEALEIARLLEFLAEAQSERKTADNFPWGGMRQSLTQLQKLLVAAADSRGEVEARAASDEMRVSQEVASSRNESVHRPAATKEPALPTRKVHAPNIAQRIQRSPASSHVRQIAPQKVESPAESAEPAAFSDPYTS